MAIVDINPVAIGKVPLASVAGIVSSTGLVASGRIGFIFRAPKTGSIDRMVWYSGTATGSPIVDVRLETVSGASPSGTLFGTNTNVVTGTVASNTEYESTLTSAASVTRGQLVGLSLNYVSGTSIAIGLDQTWNQIISAHNLPQINTAGTWSIIAARNMRSLLRYSDGSYLSPNIEGVSYGLASQTSFFTSGEKGIRFRLPYRLRICGFWQSYDVRNDITVNLYADATAPGGTALLTKQITSASLIQAGGVNQHFFDSSLTLSANTWYRLVAAFTGATGTRFSLVSFGSSDRRDAIVKDQYYTESSGSSWVDTTTQSPPIGIVLDGLEDASGGGGLILPRPMNGGYSA